MKESGSSAVRQMGKQQIQMLTLATLLLLRCTQIQGFPNIVVSSSTRSQPGILSGTRPFLQSDDFIIHGIGARYRRSSSHRRIDGIMKTRQRLTKSNEINVGFTLLATPDDDIKGWSRSRERTESPLGVRRRVRSVLSKAKNRTGVRNASEDRKQEQNALDIVAEAASIGGLGAVVTEDGSVDVALDFAPRNGDGTSRYAATKPPKPTSSPAPELNPVRTNPEDQFVVSKPSSAPALDALKADVSAAFAVPPDPLPFNLPKLSDEQQRQLDAGERVQFQSKMAREGSGFVVVDVKAPPYVVWECLLDYESYPETIPTVRDVRLFTSTHLKSDYRAETPVELGTGKATRHYGKPSITRAAFTLSKFRLNIAAIHKYRPHPQGDYLEFTLDPASSNLVLKFAKGVWHTQADPDGKQGYTRVWLLCELKVSRVLPSFIVDYAAMRAMPRATTWLKPQVEAAADLWLRNAPTGTNVTQSRLEA